MPSNEEVADAIHEFVGRLFHHDVDISDTLHTELGFSHFKALLVLNQPGPARSVNELSESLGLSLPATGRALDKLVQLGLVDRREDAKDRRVKRVSLTETGQKEVAAWFGPKEDQVRRFVAALPDALRDQLHLALRDVTTEEYLGPIDPSYPLAHRSGSLRPGTTDEKGIP